MNIIMNDFIELMDTLYIEVWGKFTPRGGISIDAVHKRWKARCKIGGNGRVWNDES